MTGNKYQNLAMRTNDGKATQRLNSVNIAYPDVSFLWLGTG